MWSITWNINEKIKVDQQSFKTYEQANTYAKYYKTLYEKHLSIFKLRKKATLTKEKTTIPSQPITYDIIKVTAQF